MQISEGPLRHMMLKALETGLANERIVTRLLPLFSQTDVPDADLKREMSKAVRACKGRKDKNDKTEKKQVRVASVGEEGGRLRDRDQEESEFLKVAKELKEEVAEVKQVTRLVFAPLSQPSQLLSQQTEQQRQQQLQQAQQEQFIKNISTQPWFRKNVFGCEKCILAGQHKTCNHCMRCGETSHKIKDCPHKENTPPASNSNRSLSRK